MIHYHKVCHGFAHHVDAGDGGNIVPALDGDSGGIVAGVDSILFLADGGYGFDRHTDDDFIAIGNARENTARVIRRESF